jgi:hypothetical protein
LVPKLEGFQKYVEKKQQYLVHVLLEITTTGRTLHITKMRRHLLGGIWSFS